MIKLYKILSLHQLYGGDEKFLFSKTYSPVRTEGEPTTHTVTVLGYTRSALGHSTRFPFIEPVSVV